jgi:hypothetical protein
MPLTVTVFPWGLVVDFASKNSAYKKLGYDAMSRRFGVVVALFLISVLGPIAAALPQCKNEITLVPLPVQQAASKAQDFVRFEYALSTSDTLLIESHRDTETTIGPYDTGLVITRNGSTLQRISLRQLPEMPHDEPEYADSFTTLAVTRACGKEGPIYFVTMQYQGDETSPALLFALVPSESGFEVSTLPMISGGVLEVYRSNPLHLRTWNNLHEGDCEACETAYEITEFELLNGKAVQTRQYRTQHLYNSGNYRFDDRRRIRFIP